MSRRRTLNAAARRERARKEAERLQHVRRRNRALIVIGSVVVVALVAVAGFVIWKGAQRTYLDDVDRTPAGADTTGGIPVSADGVAGVAATGAPRLDVYLDYQDAASVKFWQTQGEELQALSADGTVALWVHLVGFTDGGTNGFSTRAAQAAAVVADRSPEQFLAFVAAAFDKRVNGAEQLNDPDLVSIGLAVGVAEDVTDRFDDNLFNDWCVAASDQAGRDGIDATPTVQLDGTDLNGDWNTSGSLTAAVNAALG